MCEILHTSVICGIALLNRVRSPLTATGKISDKACCVHPLFQNYVQIPIFVQNQPSNVPTLSGVESGCIKYIKATDAAGVAQFHLRGNISSSLSTLRRTDATAPAATCDATSGATAGTK